MSTAQRFSRLLELVLRQPPPLRVKAWDGSEEGPPDAPLLLVNSPDAVRRLVDSPGELGLARAYVSGDLDVPDRLYDVLKSLSQLSDRGEPKGHQIPDQRASSSKRSIPHRERAELLSLAVGLKAVGRTPPPPPEEVRRLRGLLHSRSRDKAAISHHYDVGNDFYRLVLGPSMVYSCAYWSRPDDPSYTLDDAQRDKLELVCRKLGLAPGMTVLDVGCGWGSFLLHAASEYGVSGVGITLSVEQATRARERIADAGLSDQIEIRVQDWRDLPAQQFDAIASIGMAEHVGARGYAEYASALKNLLRPGGRLLNHQIARPPGPVDRKPTFINRYVFPDGELLPLAVTLGALEDAGLEVRDAESLREHYARTLRAWVANIEANWDQAVALTSLGRAKVWRLYMAASALAFESGNIGVNQVLAVRPGPPGESGLAPRRSEWVLPADRAVR
ncbi:MAG: cyclopropane-fatty-acyl-phospholipid synthase family protein [Sporichthyaceae bacterium]